MAFPTARTPKTVEPLTGVTSQFFIFASSDLLLRLDSVLFLVPPCDLSHCC